MIDAVNARLAAASQSNAAPESIARTTDVDNKAVSAASDNQKIKVSATIKECDAKPTDKVIVNVSEKN